MVSDQKSMFQIGLIMAIKEPENFDKFMKMELSDLAEYLNTNYGTKIERGIPVADVLAQVYEEVLDESKDKTDEVDN